MCADICYFLLVSSQKLFVSLYQDCCAIYSFNLSLKQDFKQHFCIFRKFGKKLSSLILNQRTEKICNDQ